MSNIKCPVLKAINAEKKKSRYEILKEEQNPVYTLEAAIQQIKEDRKNGVKLAMDQKYG